MLLFELPLFLLYILLFVVVGIAASITGLSLALLMLLFRSAYGRPKHNINKREN